MYWPPERKPKAHIYCTLVLTLEKYRKVLDEKRFYHLVAEQHIHVGHDQHEVILEKLRDKRRRQVQAKHLVGFRGMLRHFQDGLHRNGQEKSLDGNRRRLTTDLLSALATSTAHSSHYLQQCSRL